MKKSYIVLVVLLLVVLCLWVMTSFSQPARAQEGTLSPAGKLFIKDAASVGMMEIKLGRIAQGRGDSLEVKSFGDRMVLEHTKASQELNTIAAQRNLKLPVQLARRHVLMIARLSKLTGSEFDRNYMQTMKKNHLSSVARFKKALKKVTDPDLKAFAAATLPVLQQHLQMAQELARKLGRS
jgi:putative membrane protein